MLEVLKAGPGRSLSAMRTVANRCPDISNDEPLVFERFCPYDIENLSHVSGHPRLITIARPQQVVMTSAGRTAGHNMTADLQTRGGWLMCLEAS
jgi:hypothetical protein